MMENANILKKKTADEKKTFHSRKATSELTCSTEFQPILWETATNPLPTTSGLFCSITQSQQGFVHIIFLHTYQITAMSTAK